MLPVARVDDICKKIIIQDYDLKWHNVFQVLLLQKPASSGMCSNVFQVVQAFLRDSGIAQVFHGFLWKMLEAVLENVEMSNGFPGRLDIYKIIRVA